jgi:hypothetical protein
MRQQWKINETTTENKLDNNRKQNRQQRKINKRTTENKSDNKEK